MKWAEQLLTLLRFILGVMALFGAVVILCHLALQLVPPSYGMIHLARVTAAFLMGVCGTLLLDGRGRR